MTRLWLSAASLSLLLGLAAAQDKPDPVRTTVKTCGGYQVKLTENGFGDPQDSVSLVKGGKTYATYRDEMVSLDACTDLTGDGVPEAILTTFSGGAHCCTMGYIYSLSTPPRLLLEQGMAHSQGWDIAQLDGKGPKELVTGDWRFAYAFEMSFADSPALPQIMGYRGGRYVDVTREFPQYLLKNIRPLEKDSLYGGALSNYALYLMAGQPQQAENSLNKLPQPVRDWLSNYAPDIRQNLSDVGIWDWPLRTGVPLSRLNWGIGGSFSAPGQTELLATIMRGNTGELRLYRRAGEKAGGQVTASAPLLTYAVPPQDSPLNLSPVFTVRRATGRDDAVIQDSTSGSVYDRAYRVGPSSFTALQNDPLGVACLLLGQMQDLGMKRASLYRSSVKTDAQRRVVAGRISAAQAKAAAWQKLFDPTSKTPLDLARLGAFEVQSLEVSREDDTSALVAGVAAVGHVTPDQSSDYVQSKRQTFAIFLSKQGGVWKVTRWQLTPRVGAGPLGQ